MSTYSNRLQSAVQNLLQRVVRFFHPRSLCLTHISADVCGREKSLVKPVTQQNISNCSVLSPEIIIYDDAYIGGRSENNIICVVYDDLGWKNRTTRYILLHHWLTSDFLSFIDVELIRFFHGALQLFFHILMRFDWDFTVSLHYAYSFVTIKNRASSCYITPLRQHCLLTPLVMPPFRLAASVLWCWSRVKEGRAVEVVPGILDCRSEVSFSICTATRTSSYSPVAPSVFYLA